MAVIQWAQLCELAFLDGCGRLCMIGVTTHLPVPSLPLALHQLMIAARVIDVQQGDEVDVWISILTPQGALQVPTLHSDLDVTVAGGEYLLVTLRDIPLKDAGLYRVLIGVGNHEPTLLEVPVTLLAAHACDGVH